MLTNLNPTLIRKYHFHLKNQRVLKSTGPFLSTKILLSLAALLFLSVSAVAPRLEAQSFGSSNLNFNGNGGVSNSTSLKFGPDGRLYTLNLNGTINIFTIQRNGPNNYVVLSSEQLLQVKNIPNHNDDGSPNAGNNRLCTGITVAGTAQNPVIYATSSDSRIGGPSGDTNLDTNSGVITRLTWNGSSWDVVDIVRGLPRSEENHATNGLEFTTVNGTDYLIVCSGGHTNAGAPSKNFAWITEYALSAAILSVNLTQLQAMPINIDAGSGRQFIYDIPTLDDPTRPNANGITDPDDLGYDGIDVGDPWGGNDGLNQAMVVPGGPVQIFSPGYRNTYDLVVTMDGKVLCTDNGANGGWGGLPVNQGMSGNVNNDYDPAEPGSSSPVNGEQVNNVDHLTLITNNISNYTFGSFYGGHPTPVRGNPYGAGLFTNPGIDGPSTLSGQVFRTLTYDPDESRPNSTSDASIALPANWPPVTVANIPEGDWRGPGMPNPDGPADVLLTIWGTNTNGIDEYKASNFGGAMYGDLIAGVNGGTLRRVELNPDGSLKQLTPTFASNLGGNALGIACNGDNEIFPGTIWVASFNTNIVVLEPQDFGVCILPDEAGYDPQGDNDGDGYTNQDEIDNLLPEQTIEEVICNAAAQPQDFDKEAGGILISDLNDPDDDSDDIPDAEDPFQLGDFLKDGSDAFLLPVENELFSDNLELKGYRGLGMTGLMNNGATGPNWLNWLDRRDDPSDPNPNDILGGAIGAMTMQMTAGTALGTSNTQEKGFQYGVQVSQATGSFTVETRLLNFNDPLQLYGSSAPANGELGFQMGTGFQDNYIKFVLTPAGIEILQEINDVPQTPITLNLSQSERPSSSAILRFNVTCATGEVSMQYAFDGGAFENAGSLTAQGAILSAIQNAADDLAVGFIGTSNQVGFEVEGTWDYLNAFGSQPFIVQTIENIDIIIGEPNSVFDLNEYFDDDGGVGNLTYSISQNSNTAIGAVIASNVMTISFPATENFSTITVRATDQDGLFAEQTFTVNVTDEPIPLIRIRANGPTLAATDAPNPDWITSGAAGPQTGSFNGIIFSVNGGNFATHNIANRTPEVPAYVPQAIYAQERWAPSTAQPMLWTFDLPDGNYIVRLYMGNGFQGTSAPGARVFSILIEGVMVAENLDLSATFGHQTGGMVEHALTLTDGTLNIALEGVVENPTINGIEILQAGGTFVSAIAIEPIAAQESEEGDIIFLPVLASGGDENESFEYSAAGLPGGIQIEPTTGLIFGTVAAGASAGSPYNAEVTVAKTGSDPLTFTFAWVVNEPPLVSSASIGVTANGALGASSTEENAFQIENTGESDIVGVRINTASGFMKKLVFDPLGTASDATSNCLAQGSATLGAVGITVPASGGPGSGDCEEVFAFPFNGIDNAEGYNEISLEFTDFNPGEIFAFSVGVNPTSLKGGINAGSADAVSGFELIGATVTITFSNGLEYITSLFDDGSAGGSGAEINLAAHLLQAPAISINGTAESRFTADLNHTIDISGPPNATVSLLQVDTRLYVDPSDPEIGYNIEAFEANEAMARVVQSTTLDGSGNASISVTLLQTASTDAGPDGGINHFIAVTTSPEGEHSAASNAIVLSYDANATGQLALSGTLQGRSNHSGTYLVRLYPQGEANVPAYTFNATASETGEMNISGIVPGTYQVAVKFPNSLQKVFEHAVTSTSGTLNFGQLRMGDANNNNTVSLQDYSILVATFNKQEGSQNYDPRADFNGSQSVISVDFSILVSNFNTAGQVPVSE